MSATWTDVYLSAAVCVGVLIVPGALVALAARTPFRLALTVALPLSATFVVAASVFAPRLGITWGLRPVALVTACAILLSLPIGIVRTIRYRQGKSKELAPWEGCWWALPIALLIAGFTHLVRLTQAISLPFAVSQTYDSPFHHNLVARFLEDGNASFMRGNLTTYGEVRGFYPALWHQLTALNALTVDTDGTPAALNGTLLAVTTIVWPLGIALLIGWVMRSWNLAALGALLAFATPQMPNHFTWFGVLYPNLLAYAMIAFYLAIGVNLLFPQKGSQPWWGFILALIGLPGLAIAHPSGFISFVVLIFPLLLIGTWVRVRSITLPGTVGHWLWPAVASGSIILLYALVNEATMHVPALAHMRTNIYYWQPRGNAIAPLIQALILKPGWSMWVGGMLPVALGLLVIIGAVYAMRSPRTAWLVATHAITVTLFIIAFSVGGQIRPYIVGLWYSDIERFAALTGVSATPLLALGTYATASLMWRYIKRFTGVPTSQENEHSSLWKILIPVGICVFLIGQFSGTLTRSYAQIHAHMDFDTPELSTFGMLSLNEVRLMGRMHQYIPEDAQVIGNPWNGSTFAPAFAGVTFLYPHVAPVNDEDAAYVSKHLNEAAEDPRVCDIIRDRNITHVLDFGQDFLWGGDWNGSHLLASGIYALEETHTARLVDQEGSAKLFEITACTDN